MLESDKSWQSREFFASPESEKASIPISADNKGWSGMLSETLDPATQKRGDFKQCVGHQITFLVDTAEHARQQGHELR
jgi:hypothetical protein